MPQVFRGAVITEQGLEMLNRIKLNEIDIEFTKIETGDGIYTENEKTTEYLMKKQQLRGFKQSFPISSVQKHSGNIIKMKTLISNVNLKSGYYINEMGLYAKEMGSGKEEILFSITVTQGDCGDYLPPYNGFDPAEIIQEYYATVSNTEQVIIKSNSGAVALAEDLAVHKASGDHDDRYLKLTGGILTGGLRATSIKADGSGKVKGGEKTAMWTDNEGGNISLESKNGTSHWEMDAFNENYRIYCINGGSMTANVTIKQNGNVVNSKGDYETKNGNTIETNASNLIAHKISTDHDDRYYTESEIDSLLSTINTKLGDCLKFVGDGKIIVANAITAQGVSTATDADFSVLAANITAAGNARYNTGHSTGYNAGVVAADARVNTSSASYTTGYNNGVTAADNRANTSSVNYKTGYNAGVVKGQNDVKNNPRGYGLYTKAQYDANYDRGYDAGVTAGKSGRYIVKTGSFTASPGSNSSQNYKIGTGLSSTKATYFMSESNDFSVTKISNTECRVWGRFDGAAKIYWVAYGS